MGDIDRKLVKQLLQFLVGVVLLGFLGWAIHGLATAGDKIADAIRAQRCECPTSTPTRQ